MKHVFKPGEKEAVATVLGIEPEMIPDQMDLEDETDDEDELDSELDEDDEDEEEDDDDEEVAAEEDDDEDDEEEVDQDVETLKLMDEWRKEGHAELMPFSEFLKNRGK